MKNINNLFMFIIQATLELQDGPNYNYHKLAL